MADIERETEAPADDWQPRPGRLHAIDEAFYGLAIKERDYERAKVDRLESQLAEAVDALKAIRDHGKVEGHECWALHQGDCAEVFQEIARATLDRLGEQ